MTRRGLLMHAWAQFALWIALAAVCLHLTTALGVRLDVTHDQRHSLSPAAAMAVARLQTPLTVTVWFTEDLGPPYHNHRTALLDMLAEVSTASDDLLDVVVRDPTSDPAAIEEATAAGIRPVTWAYRDAHQTQARKVWMGASLAHGSRSVAIDALPAIDRMEHDLVRAILAVTTEVEDRRTVAWVQGNGEPELAKWGSDHPLGKLREGLQKRHDVVAIRLDKPIPEDVDVLLVVGPQIRVPAHARWQIDQFVMRGGAVAWFLAGWQPDFREMRVREVQHGLDGLLASYGIRVQRDLLLDRKRNEPMTVPMGDALVRVNYPLALASTHYDRSWAPVRDLPRAVVPFASTVAIDPNAPGDLEGALWLQTEGSAVSTRRLGSLVVEDIAQPRPDETAGPHPVVVAVQGSFTSAFQTGAPELPDGIPPTAPLLSSAPTRMVVAGSADMVANNIDLVLNSVDWLLSDPTLVEIRGRSMGPPPLDPPDRATAWKLGIAGVPLGLLAGLGLLVGTRRRR